ncbi:hypothetical protein [Paracidobacterium acidisoli]|uniref:hypothetical protein n=1 Tax=Paracidobacterium acidisoli TaxID=2303751 RepID=UPI001314234C|nr:hypothetical protein [Paracidobacterium acidisoli]MBT9330327.1 DUF2846 domain-containing protein [Paracidobacterium acidisoli]
MKLDNSRHSLAQPDSGKALIYFIQERVAVVGVADSMLFGIDGTWVGADRGNSYFSVSINPGEHHICAALPYYRQTKSSGFHRETKIVVPIQLDAKAGKTYFYLAQHVTAGYTLEVTPVSRDEGKYLIASYPLSVSHNKHEKE